MVELSFAIPLITLVLVDGDIRHEQSTDQQPAVNVRLDNYHYIWQY